MIISPTVRMAAARAPKMIIVGRSSSESAIAIVVWGDYVLVIYVRSDCVKE